MQDNIQKLHDLSECLIEKENLTGDQVDEIIATGKLICQEQPVTTPVEPAVAHTDIKA